MDEKNIKEETCNCTSLQSKILYPIEICINRQSRNYISTEDLLGIINRMVFDEKHSLQIYNMFSEVPVQMIMKLFLNHQIGEAVFKEYYITYIQPIHPNKELEEMLAYVSI